MRTNRQKYKLNNANGLIKLTVTERLDLQEESTDSMLFSVKNSDILLIPRQNDHKIHTTTEKTPHSQSNCM